MPKPLQIVLGSVCLVAALAACSTGSHPKAQAAASRAAASASAFATSSPAASASAAIQKDLQTCAASTNVLAHPVLNHKAFITCLRGHAANKAKFDACVRGLVLRLGIGTGKVAEYEAGLLTCMSIQ